jgi:fumarate reductase subunit D
MKTYLTRLVKPLAVIPDAMAAFCIFLCITIVVGQAGILLTLLTSLSGSGMTFKGIISDNLVSGNFYTFSISLIASSITPFLVEYLDKKQIHFRSIKIIGSVLAIVFLLLPMTCLFARHIGTSSSSTSDIHIDWIQLIFYGFSILSCTYLYCVFLLDYDYPSYAELDRQEVVKLGVDSAAKTQDSQGNKL